MQRNQSLLGTGIFNVNGTFHEASFAQFKLIYSSQVICGSKDLNLILSTVYLSFDL